MQEYGLKISSQKSIQKSKAITLMIYAVPFLTKQVKNKPLCVKFSWVARSLLFNESVKIVSEQVHLAFLFPKVIKYN